MIQTLSAHGVFEPIFEEGQEGGGGGEGDLSMGCISGVVATAVPKCPCGSIFECLQTLSPRDVFGPPVEGQQEGWGEQEEAGGWRVGPLGAAKHDPSGLTGSRVRVFGSPPDAGDEWQGPLLGPRRRPPGELRM